MILATDVACFLCDAVFAYFYLGTAERRPDIPAWRRYGALVFLIATFILYPLRTPFSNATNFWMRFFYRFAAYSLYLITANGTRSFLALYCSALCSSMCTVIQNAFLSALTFPIMREEWSPFSSAALSALLCVLIVCGVRAIFYICIYRTVPLGAILRVGAARVAVLTAVTGLSVYIRQYQVPLNSAGETTPEASLYFILLQVALLLCLIFFEQYQRKLQENAAYRLQQVTAEALMKNIQVRQEKDEELRSLRHDLKNHLFTLRHLIDAGEKDEAESYIDELLGQAGQSSMNIHTGSPLLDALMSEKLGRAVSDGISVSVVLDFKQGDFIDDFDLCVIIGNALDNAIESCEAVESTERFIDIKGGPAANNLLIRIANSALRDFRLADGLPLTTKADRENHGFGLRGMRRSLKKYSGSMDTSCENGRFVLTLMIPLQEE